MSAIEAEQARLAEEEQRRRIEENQRRLMETVTQAGNKKGAPAGGSGVWASQPATRAPQSSGAPTLRDIERQEQLRKKQQVHQQRQRMQAAGLAPAPVQAGKTKSWLQAAGKDAPNAQRAQAKGGKGGKSGKSLLDIEAEERTRVVKKTAARNSGGTLAAKLASSSTASAPAAPWAGKQATAAKQQLQQPRQQAQASDDGSFWGSVAAKKPTS